jgi:hypothetical protein
MAGMVLKVAKITERILRGKFTKIKVYQGQSQKTGADFVGSILLDTGVVRHPYVLTYLGSPLCCAHTHQ